MIMFFLRLELDFVELLDILIFYKDCSHTELVANGVCNDESNNADCHFDGGDCTTNTSTTTQATTTGQGSTNSTTAGGCTGNPSWIGDGYCDDNNNNMDCSYDGGDCCGCNVETSYCSVCGCLDPNGSGGGTTCPQSTTGTTTQSTTTMTASTTTISTLSTTHDPGN